MAGIGMEFVPLPYLLLLSHHHQKRQGVVVKSIWYVGEERRGHGITATDFIVP